MTTYEEDIVDVYFNIKNYFTMKNIPFDANTKQKGGEGRGEIDILALRVKNNKIIDIIHIEVSVGNSPFPFKGSEKQKKSSAVYKILKKFIQNDSHIKINKILGKTKYKCLFITSEFNKKTLEKLREELLRFSKEFKVKYKIKTNKNPEGIELMIYKKGIKRKITITPFSKILDDLRLSFKENKLEKKNFQDPRLRGIQYLVRYMNTN